MSSHATEVTRSQGAIPSRCSTFDRQRWIFHPWRSALWTRWAWPGPLRWAGEPRGSGLSPPPPGSWSRSRLACLPRPLPLPPADWWASCACSRCSGPCSTSETLRGTCNHPCSHARCLYSSIHTQQDGNTFMWSENTLCKPGSIVSKQTSQICNIFNLCCEFCNGLSRSALNFKMKFWNLRLDSVKVTFSLYLCLLLGSRTLWHGANLSVYLWKIHSYEEYFKIKQYLN